MTAVSFAERYGQPGVLPAADVQEQARVQLAEGSVFSANGLAEEDLDQQVVGFGEMVDLLGDEPRRQGRALLSKLDFPFLLLL